MNKEICFISSPGNGLSCCCCCCCCCCRPDYSIRRGRHRKWKEAPEPNPHPKLRWKNSRAGSTSAFEGTTKCEGWEKQKASLLPLDDKCLEATHSPPVSSSHLSLTGYIPTHSPTSPTSTLRAARAHDADLQICMSVPP